MSSEGCASCTCCISGYLDLWSLFEEKCFQLSPCYLRGRLRRCRNTRNLLKKEEENFVLIGQSMSPKLHFNLSDHYCLIGKVLVLRCQGFDPRLQPSHSYLPTLDKFLSISKSMRHYNLYSTQVVQTSLFYYYCCLLIFEVSIFIFIFYIHSKNEACLVYCSGVKQSHLYLIVLWSGKFY